MTTTQPEQQPCIQPPCNSDENRIWNVNNQNEDHRANDHWKDNKNGDNNNNNNNHDSANNFQRPHHHLADGLRNDSKIEDNSNNENVVIDNVTGTTSAAHTTTTMTRLQQPHHNHPQSEQQQQEHSSYTNEAEEDSGCCFTIGQLVSVESRTSPGINQPGGIGRITSVMKVTGSNNHRVSVKYVLDGRHEKNIDIIYVKSFSFDDPVTSTTASTTARPDSDRSYNQRHFSFRNRNLLLGRCTYCGSLRTDCQSCDYRNYNHTTTSSNDNTVHPTNAIPKRRQRRRRNDPGRETVNYVPGISTNDDGDADSSSTSSSGSSSSSTEQYDTMIRKHRKEYLKYKRMIQKAQRLEQKQQQQQRHQKQQRNGVAATIKNRMTATIDVLATVGGVDDDDDDDGDGDTMLNPVWNHLSLNNSSRNKKDDDDNNQRTTSRADHDEFVTDLSVYPVDDNDMASSSTNECQELPQTRYPTNTLRKRYLSSGGSETSSDGDDDEMDRLSLHQLVALQSLSSTQQNKVSNGSKQRGSSSNRTSAQSKERQQYHHETLNRKHESRQQSDLSIRNSTNSATAMDETFIQPEGNADQLPSDVYDQTRTLSYPELITFFDTTFHRMESIHVPNAKQELIQIEKDYKSYAVNNDSTIQSNVPDHMSKRVNYLSSAKDLQVKCNSLHDEFIQKLIRDGYDQCQLALRKLNSKKFYKQYRDSSLTTTNRQQDDPNTNSFPSIVPFLGRSDDIRELKLDAMNQTIEGILSKFRWYIQSSRSIFDEEGDDGSNMSTSYASNNGSDSENSDIRFDQETYENVTDRKSRSHDLLDLHPYASKKRRKKIIITTGKSRKKNPKTKQKKIDDVEPISEIQPKDFVTGGQDDSDNDSTSNGRSGSDAVMNHDSDTTDIIYDSEDRYMHQSKSTNNDALFRTRHHTVPGRQVKTRKSNQHRSRDRMEKWLQKKDQNPHGDANDPMHVAGSNQNHRKVYRKHDEDNCSIVEDLRQEGTNGIVTVNFESQFQSKTNSELRKFNQDESPFIKDVLNEMMPSDSIPKMKEFLFSTLCDIERRSNNMIGNYVPSESNLNSLCVDVDTIQSFDSLINRMNRICDRFENSNTYEASDASLVFETLHRMLTADEIVSLQDHVSSNSPNLDRFLCVLVTILRLIGHKVNHKLASSDGIVFEIFGIGQCQNFVDFCFVQLVDTTMSLFQPLGWDLRRSDTRKILQKLEGLRNELSCHMHLTERVCGCLSNELPPQEWRCVRDGKRVFVSSIDPYEWIDFLTLGKKRNMNTTARFNAFAEYIPRCEVDAVWCSLAFLSGNKPTELSPDSKRWTFTSQLMLNGSLSRPKTQTSIPPDRDQLEAAIDDMRSFINLIKCGTMEPLPRRDNVVFDVIHRTLSLQEEHLHTPECTVYDLQLMARNGKKLVVSILEEPQATMTFTFHTFVEQLLAPNIDSSWTELWFFLPSSRLLRCCLALILVWKGQIPQDKKKRLQCLDNAVKACIKELSIEITAIDDQKSSRLGEVDAFSAAFDSSTENVKCGVSRNTFFRLESIAYITIFSSLLNISADGSLQSLYNQGDSSIAVDTWKLLTDDVMQSRQKWIASGVGCRPSEVYCGEELRVLVGAKAMSFLGVLLVDSVNGSALSAHEHISEHSARSWATSTSLFIVSCLITCMDCVCDLDSKSETLSLVITSSTIFLKIIFSYNKKKSCCSDTWNIANMISVSNVMQRMFYYALNYSKEMGDDLCFPSAIAFIHLMLANSQVEYSGNISSIPVNSDVVDDADLFDEIDDAELASMEIETNDSMNRSADIENPHSMYRLLTDVLELSKPSNRTAFVPHVDEVDRISSQSMKLINKYSDKICDILVDATTKWRYSGQMPWKSNNPNFLCDEGHDNEYFKELAIYLSRKICERNDSLTFRDIVRNDAEHFIFCVLESVMDNNLMRKFPSCNLDRIAKRCGLLGEEQGFTELVEFRNGNPTRLYTRLIQVRNFCGNLGCILMQLDQRNTLLTYNVGETLMKFSNDADRSMFVPSIERECFRRFQLLRNIVRKAAVNFTNCEKLSFERLATNMLRMCSVGVIQLLERIAIKDRAHVDVPGDSYSRSKLFETVACCLEVHATLVTDLLLAVSQIDKENGLSGSFNRLYQFILNDYIPYALDGTNLMLGIQKLIGHCLALLCNRRSFICQIGSSLLSCYDLKPYFDIYQNSLLRRTRELTLSFALNVSTNSHQSLRKFILSLFQPGNSHSESRILFIGQSFSTSKYYGSIAKLESVQNSQRSPFEIAIDAQYAKWEDDEVLTKDQLKAVRNMKVKTVSIVAGLLHSRGDTKTVEPTKKYLLFRFLQVIFDQEQDERICYDSVGENYYDIIDICSIIKQIGSTLRNEMLHATTTVNESLLLLVFTCARSLLCLPVEYVDHESSGCLVDWACPSSSSSSPSPSRSIAMLYTEYIWHGCCWIRDIGELILNKSSGQLAVLRRKQIEEYKSTSLGLDESIKYTNSWASLCTFDNTSVQLNELEEKVFPTRVEPKHQLSIENKYRTVQLQKSTARSDDSDINSNMDDQINGTTRASHTSISFDEWKPNTELYFAIRRYIDKIKFATPITNTTKK